jgi:hypothetical protein
MALRITGFVELCPSSGILNNRKQLILEECFHGGVNKRCLLGLGAV